MQWFYDLLKYILKVKLEKFQMCFSFNQQNISFWVHQFKKKPYESTIHFDATVNSILLWYHFNIETCQKILFIFSDSKSHSNLGNNKKNAQTSLLYAESDRFSTFHYSNICI